MSNLPTFAAGSEPLAAEWQALLPTDASPAGNQIVNNSTTLVNDNQLQWVLTNANALYEFRATILYTSNATANFKCAFTFGAGCRMDFGVVGYLVGGASTVNLTAFNNYTSGAAMAFAGGGVDGSLLIHGAIFVSTAPATVRFQFAQNTLNVSNTIRLDGSFGVARQVT